MSKRTVRKTPFTGQTPTKLEKDASEEEKSLDLVSFVRSKLSQDFPDTEGLLQVKPLWEEHDLVRFRANWWTRNPDKLTHSVFVTVDVSGELTISYR